MSPRGEATSEDEEVRKLAEAKARIEKRIRWLERELEHSKSVLKVVNSTLVERSFKRVEVAEPSPTIPVTPAPPPPALAVPVKAYKQVIPLKTATGVLLVNMQIGDDEVRVTPAEGIMFNVNTPPFQPFLVSRILEPMQVKDREAARTGEITPDKIFSYNVVRDGDIIREIVIRNYRDPRRLQEIKTSLRWTFDKMYEKTVQTGV